MTIEVLSNLLELSLYSSNLTSFLTLNFINWLYKLLSSFLHSLQYGRALSNFLSNKHGHKKGEGRACMAHFANTSTTWRSGTNLCTAVYTASSKAKLFRCLATAWSITVRLIGSTTAFGLDFVDRPQSPNSRTIAYSKKWEYTQAGCMSYPPTGRIRRNE